MKVRKAKKILKEQTDNLHPDRKRYVYVAWQKKRKVFLCDDIWGQRYRISLL